MIHGGALAIVLDESLGAVALRSTPARTGVTANLDINYRAPVYSGNFYSVHSRLDQERSTDRKMFVSGELRDASGKLCVEATGLFVVPKNLTLRKIPDTF
jgi:acyl-coenzyme A thioesterase PaaI-like protein